MAKVKFFVELPPKRGQGWIILKGRVATEVHSRRTATPLEIARADVLRGEIEAKRHAVECAKQELARVEARCDHKVIFEKEMEGYVIHNCYACGHPTGIL